MNTSLGNPALQEKFTQKKCNSVIITHDIQNQYFFFFHETKENILFGCFFPYSVAVNWGWSFKPWKKDTNAL